MNNTLILGDCLEAMRKLPAESVDLVYLDPPFFSNRNYEVIWGDTEEVRSFCDRWSGGIDQYVAWLKERVEQMYRVLKPTGSIFLHCDWHANAYIRVEILDKIFGLDNFKGEIVWQRTNAHNDAKKKLAVLTDTIWYYSKSKDFTYNPVYSGLDEAYKGAFYRHEDEQGVYRLGDLTSPNPRPNLMYEYKGYKPHRNGWRYSLEKMQELDAAGLIHYPKDSSGRLAFKRYLDTSKGNLLGNLWTDIQNVQSGSKEKIGYPTQKPETLLTRIVAMASNKGDLVLDPFVGGGTTVAVADRMERRWVGIDQSPIAIRVTDSRLQAQRDLFSSDYTVDLYKLGYNELRSMEAFEFEALMVAKFGGEPNAKQRGDLGLDGRMPDGTPVQVKRMENVGRNLIDNFKSAIERDNKRLLAKNIAARKPIGHFIAFSFGKGAVQEVARLKNQENIIISLVKVADVVPVAQEPHVTISFRELRRDGNGLRELEFTATPVDDSAPLLYSWDFAYDVTKGFCPSVILDANKGCQVHTFKPGHHHIAVKVSDAAGLKSIEDIHLKLNGAVEVMN